MHTGAALLQKDGQLAGLQARGAEQGGVEVNVLAGTSNKAEQGIPSVNSAL
jgi:hypothetical protein